MPGLAATIAVSGLRFAYDGAVALDGVSFSALPGTITALVGPNGAGKTTLMRCLAGLEAPERGTLSVAGADVVAEPRAARARIGFLQDFFGLYDRLSVRRVLDYAARSRLVPSAERERRIRAVADGLGIADLLDRPASALSRGQRQRVAIGAAIIHRPPVLMLDEPAAGLDPEAREALAALMRSLAAEGMTLLVSSHILAELEAYATDVLMLEAGRVIGHGPLAAPARRLALVLAGAAEGRAQAILAARGIDGTEIEGGTILFSFAGDLAGQATLLAELVGAGIPVAALEERRSSIQALYLSRLREARGQ